MITYCSWLAFEIGFIVSLLLLPMKFNMRTSHHPLTFLPQYFMFPETYGRTLEELAFLFEDRALADEATMNVEKQMKYVDKRFSRVDDRGSWEMDVVLPNKVFEGRGAVNGKVTTGQGRRGPERAMGRGGWWED